MGNGASDGNCHFLIMSERLLIDPPQVTLLLLLVIPTLLRAEGLHPLQEEGGMVMLADALQGAEAQAAATTTEGMFITWHHMPIMPTQKIYF